MVSVTRVSRGCQRSCAGIMNMDTIRFWYMWLWTDEAFDWQKPWHHFSTLIPNTLLKQKNIKLLSVMHWPPQNQDLSIIDHTGIITVIITLDVVYGMYRRIKMVEKILTFKLVRIAQTLFLPRILSLHLCIFFNKSLFCPILLAKDKEMKGSSRHLQSFLCAHARETINTNVKHGWRKGKDKNTWHTVDEP